MSERTAKTARRDLRRAFGASAVSMITDHQQGIAFCVQELAKQAQAIENGRACAVTIGNNLLDLERQHYNFTHKTFVQRLKWIALGR